MSVVQPPELGDLVKALEALLQNISNDKSIVKSIREENYNIVDKLLKQVNEKVIARDASAQGLQWMWVKAIATLTLPSRDAIIARLNRIYKNYRSVSAEEDARQRKEEQKDSSTANPTSDMKGHLGAPIQNFAALNDSTSWLPSASQFPGSGPMPA